MRKSNYSFCEKIQNIIFLLKTKILYPPARLVRFPFIVRGKDYIDFGKNLTTGRNCRIDVNGKHKKKILIFGENVNIGDNVRLSVVEKVIIGSNVLMGSRILIIDNSHGSYTGDNQDNPAVAPNERKLVTKPVIIGDNVWLGEGVIVLPGACIGDGCIIGANAIVSKEIPSQCIVVGNNEIIKRWNGDKGIWEKCR